MWDMSDRCDRWLNEQEIKCYPPCDHCKQPIQSEWRYRIDGELLCEVCWDNYVRDNIREYNDEVEI